MAKCLYKKGSKGGRSHRSSAYFREGIGEDERGETGCRPTMMPKKKRKMKGKRGPIQKQKRKKKEREEKRGKESRRMGSKPLKKLWTVDH
uniref:Uncharacterized protein n=1 Tax=Chromera velia CCMP2878 TaxID=1169474 RepID=A0A0G4FWE6_9ALVE|eukprot:Cvel_19114.t1-p1 / transcript=Cvel_19114.t1 / gene=Cvel_19114 / organism=Chromera_velia_CCMP2878 / gene_product=hypothetical protein / transcript_product=hypothetical protein / location=Cvel_scaffold1623:41890-42156(-) / protein_length=89 / sequence_SO=supercontig / SO=protein_coding / is_pseudo=false